MSEEQEDAFAFICPILNGIFQDPVKAEDGRTYEREGIEAWFASCRQRNLPITSPWTRQVMGTNLTPDPKTAAAAKNFRYKVGNASRSLDIRAALEDIPSVLDLRNVFAALDPLRSILEKSLDGWQPPQFVVVGQESSGKSTLLERLAMMPIFPRNDKICTRLPIHVRLRNTETCKPATLEVFNVSTNTTEDAPYVIPTEYGAVDVREKMEQIIAKEHGAINGGVSSERIIILTIHSPYVPSIDLVDMPGLVESPESMKESTRKVAEEHIRKHGQYSLFLATVSAIEAPNLSAAVQLVQSKKLQDRTIGVFTMCDEVVPIERRKRLLIERLQTPPPPGCGAEPLEPHGWVCLMNKEIEQADCSNFARLKQQALDEEAFMREHMPTVFDQGNAGCGALMKRLSQQFLQFLMRTWGPKTVKLLAESLAETHFQNASLGIPAFHIAGSKHAADARGKVASEAKRRMEAGKDELVQGCCANVLKQLKEQLTNITSEQLVKVHPSTFPAKWKAQREKFEAACSNAIDNWGKYWVQGVRDIVKKREPAPQTTAAKKKLVGEPVCELDRFPTFVSAVESYLNEMLGPVKASILEGISVVADKYYGIMSPWVTVVTELDGAASVSVTCNHSAVVENAMLCFIQEGDASMFGKLCTDFVSICAQLPDAKWIESCADKRKELLVRIDTLEEAKRGVLQMLGAQSEKELMKRLNMFVGVVEGSCQHITNMSSPTGVAVDANGHLYVANAGDNSIRVFSGAGPNGTPIRQFGSGNFSSPMDMAVDCEGNVYVCDSGNHLVRMFNKEGTYVKQFGSGGGGTAAGQLYSPYGVAVDFEGNVYVSNYSGNTVSIFGADGTFVKNITSGLSNPHGLALDCEGNLYVSNCSGHTVRIYNREGEYVRLLGTGDAGSGPGQLYNPYGVAVDCEGNVYVASTNSNNMSMFDKQGTFVKQVPSNNPRNVAVDAEGQVLISENNQHRVHVVRK